MSSRGPATVVRHLKAHRPMKGHRLTPRMRPPSSSSFWTTHNVLHAPGCRRLLVNLRSKQSPCPAPIPRYFRNYFSDVLTTGKVVRLIFQGQLLRDDARSLESYGLHDQCVVHCHVGTRPYAQPNASNNGSGQTNTGAQNDGNQPNAGT